MGLLLLEILLRVFLVSRATSFDQIRDTQIRDWGGEVTLFDIIRPAPEKERVYELIPGATGIFVGAPLSVNADGFRDTTWTLQAEPGVERIAVIGDSIAFGWGVPTKDRFSDILQSKLNELAGAGSTSSTLSAGKSTRYQVMNYGVPSYNSVMELATFRAKALPYKPKIVIVNLVGNDDELPGFLRIKPQAWSLSKCFIYESIRDQMVGRKFGDTARLAAGGVVQTGGIGHGPKILGYRPELVPPEYRGLMGRDSMNKALNDIVAECRTHGIRAIGFIYRRIEKPTAEAVPLVDDEWLLEPAQKAGFEVLDGSTAMAKWLSDNRQPAGALTVSPNDMHPNKIAHEILANTLLTAFTDSGTTTP